MRSKGTEGELDSIFAEFIKQRDDYTCRRCGKRHTPTNKYYDPAHIKGRGKHSVRWDEKNVFGMCRLCHQFLDGHPKLKDEWYIHEFGQEEFDLLTERANKIVNLKNWQMEITVGYYKTKLKHG